jgi:hypothetical protein
MHSVATFSTSPSSITRVNLTGALKGREGGRELLFPK